MRIEMVPEIGDRVYNVVTHRKGRVVYVDEPMSGTVGIDWLDSHSLHIKDNMMWSNSLKEWWIIE